LVHNILKNFDAGKCKYAHFTYKLLPHYLGKCKRVIFSYIQQEFQLNGYFFNRFHSICDCELWQFISLCYSECSTWSHSARVAAASGSERDCVPAAIE